MTGTLESIVAEIYPDQSSEVSSRVESLVTRYRDRIHGPTDHHQGESLTERDSVLITYGDSFRGPDAPPLGYLLKFLDEQAEGVVSGVHILPFSPYSSDDGFSVIDYRQVNPELGSWDDIDAIADEFVLMADLVLNHCSVQGEWFKGFVAGTEPYDRYFITASPDADVSGVARPRAHPLLTEFQTANGPRWVWTTFSTDQADLDFANPDVLIEMLDVFLGYVAHGARIIRLDAIAYLWKELGTPCLHHPKTHAVVRLMRAITESVAPWVVIITETNVPHEENISYFGRGDEAHMVYNFSLPPLTLDAFIREDTGHLQRWAGSLSVSADELFFNFLASHDGIGLLPTFGILSDDQRAAMVETVQERGGLISYKATSAGEIPYEMNINYLSALAPPALPDAQRARIFLAAQSVMLSLAGVPGIYYHSLIGSENWQEGVEQTGRNRSINRRRLDYDAISDELNREGSLANLVFEGYKALLRARAASRAFHPAGGQHVLLTPQGALAILRTSPDGSVRVLCLVNVSSDSVECSFDHQVIGTLQEKGFRDLLSGDYVYPSYDGAGRISISLEPYEVLWLA